MKCVMNALGFESTNSRAKHQFFHGGAHQFTETPKYARKVQHVCLVNRAYLAKTFCQFLQEVCRRFFLNRFCRFIFIRLESLNVTSNFLCAPCENQCTTVKHCNLCDLWPYSPAHRCIKILVRDSNTAESDRHRFICQNVHL